MVLACLCPAVSSLERFVSLQEIENVIITHLAPNRLACLKAFLERRSSKQGAAQLTITLSNPALQLLRENFGEPQGHPKAVHAALTVRDMYCTPGRPCCEGSFVNEMRAVLLLQGDSGGSL